MAGGAWNRGEGKTAASVNLDGAPYGFKVTGDAAWDSDSADWSMFSEAGNLAVDAMVKAARRMAKAKPEAELVAWLEAERSKIAGDGHREVYDTMVRETIAYALDEAWQEAYGYRYGASD